MKSLLIHSKNTSLLEFEEFQKHNVDFKIPSDTDIDHYISNLIAEQIEPVNPSVIFIKYALDNDYLAFLGLRLAHHIRLHHSRVNMSMIPIIFVGEETVSELIRISDYSDILATSGVYYVNEDLNKVKALLDRIAQDSLKGLKSRESYLKKVNIPAPLNYDSRHNFINELSLFLWSDYIGCEKLNSDIQDRVQHQLYFKYRIEKDKVDREQSKIDDLPTFDTHSKIMLVDDEAEKGWDDFYEHLFSGSKNVEFKAVHFDKNSSKDTIINDCLTQIEEYNPNVILLDLRLSEKDVFEIQPQNLTGYSVLKKIKEFNKGIQIIVATASNKTSIFRELYNAGADSYIIKNIEPKISCSSLIESLRVAINESKILKPTHTSLSFTIDSVKNNQLKKLNLGEDSNYFYNELKSELISYLTLCQKLLANQNNTDRFSITLLQFHKCLEVIADYYIEEFYQKDTNSYHYEFYSGERVKYFDLNNPTNVKCHNWRQSGRMSVLNKFFNTYQYFTKRVKSSLFLELERLNNYRNDYSHPNLDHNFESLELLYEEDFKSFRKTYIRLTTAFFEFLNAIR